MRDRFDCCFGDGRDRVIGVCGEEGGQRASLCVLGKQGCDDATLALAGLPGDGDIATGGQERGDTLADGVEIRCPPNEAFEAVIDEASMVGETRAQAGDIFLLHGCCARVDIVWLILNDFALFAQPGFAAGNIGTRILDTQEDLRRNKHIASTSFLLKQRRKDATACF